MKRTGQQKLIECH